MVWIEGVIGVVLLAYLARRVKLRHQALAALSLQLRQDAARLLERRSRLELLSYMDELQERAETAVESGTDWLREVHLGAAKIPFGILETLPLARDYSRRLQQTHNMISESVYGSIKDINRWSGRLSRNLLGANRAAPRKSDSEPE